MAEAQNGSAGPQAVPAAGARPPATPEGIALAYGSLVLMALLPIFFGALRSVSCAKSKVPRASRPRQRGSRTAECPVPALRDLGAPWALGRPRFASLRNPRCSPPSCPAPGGPGFVSQPWCSEPGCWGMRAGRSELLF